jgi:hypothetical protein
MRRDSKKETHTSFGSEQVGIERHHNYKTRLNMNWKAVLRTKWQETGQDGRGPKLEGSIENKVAGNWAGWKGTKIHAEERRYCSTSNLDGTVAPVI